MTRPEARTAPLFEPFELRSATLRNRIAMAPMTRKRSPDGLPTEAVAAYYRRRAEGGFGLIFSEGTFIDHPSAQADDGASYRDIPHFFGRDALSGWERVAGAIREAGAAFMPQLWHVGEVRRLGMPRAPAEPGLGPRAIVEDGRQLVKPMDEADVEAVAQSYARAARAAEDMGCAGVALHGAHGYLMDQFLWPEINARQDGYGGSIEGRSRVARRIVAAIRDAVAPDFPIVFRFSQWKMTDYDARIVNTPDELRTLLRGLGDAGVDAFDVSTRRFWEPAFADSDESLAAWTKRLSGLPTIAVGSIGLDQPHHSKYFREKAQIDAGVADLAPVLTALAAGDFDMVAVGRASLADPNWANKIRAGDTAGIQPFVRADLERYR